MFRDAPLSMRRSLTEDMEESGGEWRRVEESGAVWRGVEEVEGIKEGWDAIGMRGGWGMSEEVVGWKVST